MSKDVYSFYGVIVELNADWDELSSLIRKDFSFFSVPHGKTPDIRIFFHKKNPAEIKIPAAISKMQSLNSITYQLGRTRYNDYYGKLLSVFDYGEERADVYSLDLDKAHEVLYLLTLSRAGKILDLRGLHKLHAFAVSLDDLVLVCMMPMKGGKSTLLQEMLLFDGVKLISDDIPLVDRLGRVLPFPIKIGFNAHHEIRLNVQDPDENIYFSKRDQYGKKKLICLNGLPDKLIRNAEPFKKIILAEAFRSSLETSQIRKMGNRKALKGLFKHGIIGIGLPMIMEYFWEFGALDFLKKSWIFTRRLMAFTMLSLRAEKILIHQGSSPPELAKSLFALMEQKR